MKRSIIAATSLIALVGCSDIDGPDIGGLPSFSEQPETLPGHRFASRRQSDGPTGNMAGRKWFDVSIEVSGNLKPNDPINIAVTYTSNFATTDADLRITLPEIESAKMSDWGNEYKTPIGIQLPAKLESSQGLAAGGQVVQNTSFSIPAAGIYRVHASAKSEKILADETTDKVQPTTHATIWLLVDDEGGKVLTTFDPEAIPDGFRRQPGPFVKLGPGEPKPDRSDQPMPAQTGSVETLGSVASLATGVFGTCSSDKVCIQNVYYDADLHGHQLVPAVGYQYRYDLGGPEGNVATGEGFADANGRFDIPCPPSGATTSGTISFDDSRAKIVPGTTRIFSLGDCGEVTQVHLQSERARTWVVAWYSITKSRDLFPARQKIEIWVDHADSDPNTCVYDPTDDVIELISDSESGCIWGRFGLFALPHEYGHALHAKKLGGLAPIPGGCPGHRPGRPSSLACAYNEGFADYHGLVAEPTVYRIAERTWFDHERMETNFWFRAEDNPSDDGSLDEAAVAAFFYDLTDPANETHDRLDIGEAALATIMNDCGVRTTGSSWNSPDGIDHLIWCLENQVDTAITGGDDYFQERESHPTQENQNDHSWDEDHIRTMWLMNLYDENAP